MIQKVRPFFKHTIWGPDGVPERDRRMSGILRWVLPLIDISYIWFGVAGYINGLATLEAATTQTWQEYWSAGLALAALTALVGLVIPKLWPAEVIGKSFLIGFIVIYLILFLNRSTTDPPLVATAGLYLSFVWLPIWRLGDLGFVWWKWRVERAKKRLLRQIETGEIEVNP